VLEAGQVVKAQVNTTMHRATAAGQDALARTAATASPSPA
jgi:hypothetical protein